MLKTGKFDGVSIISQQSNDGIWRYMQIYLLAYIFPKSKQCALGMPTMAALGFLSLSLSLWLCIFSISQKPKIAQFHFAVELIKISNEKVDFTYLALRCSVQSSAEVKANAKDEISAMQVPQSQLHMMLLMCMPCPGLLHRENVQAISQQWRGQMHVSRGLCSCYLQFQSTAEVNAVCCNNHFWGLYLCPGAAAI